MGFSYFEDLIELKIRLMKFHNFIVCGEKNKYG